MKKVFVVFWIMLFVVISFGQEKIYITQLGSGIGDGSSLSNAASMVWLNISTNWDSTGAGKVTPGDTVILNGTLTSVLVIQRSGAQNANIVLKFATNAQFSNPTWTDHIITASAKNYITINGGTNGTIKADSNGTTSAYTPPGTMTYQNDFRGIYLDGCNNVEICSLSVIGMYRRVPDCDDNHAYGSSIYMISGSRIRIHHNTISDGYYVLRYGATQAEDSIFIYNNRILNASTGIAFTGNSTGDVTNCKINDNFIDIGNEWDGSVDGSWYHGDGIHTWTANTGFIRGLEVYNNKFFGEIGAHTTSYIYLSDNTSSSKVFNNVIMGSGHPTADGMIYIFGVCDSTRILNNTIYGCDSTAGTGIEIDGDAHNCVLINNVVANVGRFSTWSANTSADTIDYNISWCRGTNSRYNYHGEIYSEINGWWWAWQNAGWDLHGYSSKPIYSDSLIPATGSNMINAGLTLPEVGFDVTGRSRLQKVFYDIGAYAYIMKQILIRIK